MDSISEIEYRGVSLDGNWVYGDLVKNRFPDSSFEGIVFIEYRENGKHFLTPVKPETVGGYTRRKDIKGKKIYEHDVIKDRFGMTFAVLLDDEENRHMGVGFPDAIWGERQGDVRYIRQYSIDEHKLQVIETIFENQEYQEMKKHCEEGEDEDG